MSSRTVARILGNRARWILWRNRKPRHELCSCLLPCPLYVCNACQAWTPWCNGAADDMPGVCDACWCKYDEGAA